MPFEENEIVMLLLGVGVLILVIFRRKPLKQLPGSYLLITSFSIVLTGWTATVVEDLFEHGSIYNRLFNYLEHFCYAGSTMMIAWWSYRTFFLGKET